MDGEDIMPDADSMAQFLESKWTPGDPIPGSLAWRKEMSGLHTPERFFKRAVNSENPLLSYLTRKMDPDDLARLEIPKDFLQTLLDARPWYEKLARSFDIYSSADLEKGSTDFQQTLTQWQACYDQNEKLTLFSVICGLYQSKPN